MDVVYPRCAGLDVHKKNVVACRLIRPERGPVVKETKTFGTMTQGLLELSDWLAEAGITHVALESTGEYWKPVYNVLEGSFELLLVNAKHIKQVPGRKTDVNDAQWLADLLQHGLMKASFVPPAPQRAFRELTRARTTFVRERATLCNRVQKVLESANIKLASVATDILGLSGRSMLRALSQGVTDASELAGLAQGQLRKKQVELEQALTGKVEAHHRIILSELLCTIESLDATIARLDAAIEEQCRNQGSNGSNGSSHPGGDRNGSRDGGGRTGSDETALSSPGLAPLPYDEAVALLDTIPGVARTTAEIIISEIGTDMSRFPSDAHLAAWTGVAPGNNRSAGKPVGTQARHGNRSVRTTLVQAANSAVRVKGTYLQAQYKRLVVRRQHKRSVMAVAHSIIVAIFHMLKNHEPYRDLGADHFDRDRPETTVKRLTTRIRKLGYQVEVQPLEMAL